MILKPAALKHLASLPSLPPCYSTWAKLKETMLILITGSGCMCVCLLMGRLIFWKVCSFQQLAKARRLHTVSVGLSWPARAFGWRLELAGCHVSYGIFWTKINENFCIRIINLDQPLGKLCIIPPSLSAFFAGVCLRALRRGRKTSLSLTALLHGFNSAAHWAQGGACALIWNVCSTPTS